MYKLTLAVTCALVAASATAEGITAAGLANTCNSCHGIGGVSAGAAIPSLAGLNQEYLLRVMQEQKRGDRFSTIMGRLLKTYSDAEIAALARHYADQEWTSVAVEAEWSQINRGRTVLRQACKRCHGAKGDKNTDEIPRIAGQWPGYVKLEAMKYIDSTFTHKKPSQDMADAISHLTDEDLAAVSQYLAGGRK